MGNNVEKPSFESRIKQLRVARDLSQKALAKKINISQSTVAAWEVGRREPTLDGIADLCAFFGVTSDYLLGRVDNPLSVVPVDTPYEQVTPFEKEILARYRHMSEAEQVMICRMLGLVHPAESRIKAKRAQ